MAELAQRIDGGAVRPHARQMLAALLTALGDSAWPVRDAVRSHAHARALASAHTLSTHAHTCVHA